MKTAADARISAQARNVNAGTEVLGKRSPAAPSAYGRNLPTGMLHIPTGP